jgi:hypothetical protein
VLDGVIAEGDCVNPKDLSALADLVKTKTGSQLALTMRLPHEKMKNATPNQGHLIAIALMIEGAISNIVTLNYDLAFSHAISKLRVKSGIADIRCPDNYQQLGLKNLIYLHRSADSDMLTWVLTTDALQKDWKGKWEEVMAGFATASPYVIFAGLGSCCGVLRHSIEKLRNAIEDKCKAFLVNKYNPSGSEFATDVGIPEAQCMEYGWVDFMHLLAKRFMEEVALRISIAAKNLAVMNDWIDVTGNVTEDINPLLLKMKDIRLIPFSVVRARWKLKNDPYIQFDTREVESLADVLIAIRLVEKLAKATAEFLEYGRIRFVTQAGKSVDVTIVCGGGILRWGALESQISIHEKYLENYSFNKTASARRVLAVQVTGIKNAAIAPPPKIIDARPHDDLIHGGECMRVWSVDEIRTNPKLVGELLQ